MNAPNVANAATRAREDEAGQHGGRMDQRPLLVGGRTARRCGSTSSIGRHDPRRGEAGEHRRRDGEQRGVHERLREVVVARRAAIRRGSGRRRGRRRSRRRSSSRSPARRSRGDRSAISVAAPTNTAASPIPITPRRPSSCHSSDVLTGQRPAGGREQRAADHQHPASEPIGDPPDERPHGDRGDREHGDGEPDAELAGVERALDVRAGRSGSGSRRTRRRSAPPTSRGRTGA